MDIDENAVKVSRKTPLSTGWKTGSTLVCGDSTDKVSGTFQLICANIVADVIIRLCPVIPLSGPGGVFIASGIIDERIDDVRAALAESWSVH